MYIKYKKGFFPFLVVLLVILACIASGCGNDAADGSGMKLKSIRAWGWNICSDIFNDAAEQYKGNHPGVKIDVTYGESDYVGIMPQMEAKIDLPDVFMIQMKDFPTMIQRYPDSFMDLTDFVKPIKDNFVESSWESVTKDGHIYGIPTDVGPAGLFYRTDIFEAAGIKPEDIETWDDLIAANAKIMAATNGNCHAMGLTADPDIYEMILNEQGGSYVSDDDKEIVMNSAESVKAITILKKLIDGGATIDVKDWNGRIVAMRRNQIACVPYGVWFAGTISSSVPEQKGKWKVMPLPAVEKGGSHAANCGGSAVCIYKGTHHPDIAKDYVNFLFNTNEGESIQLAHGIFPAYKPVQSTLAFNREDTFFGFNLFGWFAIISDQVKPLHRGPIMLDAGKGLNNIVPRLLAGKSVEDTVKETCEDVASATGLKIAK